jgi:hypothetical protein
LCRIVPPATGLNLSACAGRMVPGTLALARPLPGALGPMTTRLGIRAVRRSGCPATAATLIAPEAESVDAAT